MEKTSRSLVLETLEFRNRSGRVPRQLWTLPWADLHHPQELAEIRSSFPDDIVEVPPSHKRYTQEPKRQGDWYAVGDYIDEWGCHFHNVHEGVIGEVKAPLISEEDDEWEAASKVHIPEELLSIDTDRINEFCRSTNQFVLASELARPFERMQFIRGTENLFVDLALQNPAMLAFLKRVHDFNCRLLRLWASTDVDGLFFMDDWGSQNSLLINPKLWVEYIKPLYKDYADIAKAAGKKIFFHSDGFTLDIIPHLIDIGIDAVNLQIFCIGLEKLRPFAGKICFWGEIDRQHLLPFGTTTEIGDAVRQARESLWKDGGAIAQCEFGAGAKPENVRAVFEAWQG
ncbi:uroporphyrinogen decarboxylase family protein [Treponema sp.]